MKKLLLFLILSFFSAQGYVASCPDGSDPVKSISADGTYFVYNCGGSNEQASSSTANSSNVNSTNANLNIKAVAGIDIENDPNLDFFRPPNYDFFWTNSYWQIQDFNKDGYSDILYVGDMFPENISRVGDGTYGTCGNEKCIGDKPLPRLLFGNKNHILSNATNLIIDNREDRGMAQARRLLVTDYNKDDILDFYVADTAFVGGRDSYYLSQPNGTWVESSETHLSHPNFEVYNHGAATGDIDSDGDMDVVITALNRHTGPFLWCLVNDGTGFLKKRNCGGFLSWSLELADLDGDLFLDLIFGGVDRFTGIIWNDGKGNFPQHNFTSLFYEKKEWSSMPEVSAADLDNDGDLDIVYSKTGHLYVGTALHIIENLGNRKFKDHGIFPLVEAPADFIPTHEGNEWNDFIDDIRFRDLDKDGDIDMYLSSSMSRKTNGMVLLNQGDFSFSIIKHADLDEISGKPKIVVDKVKKKFKYSARKSQLKLLTNQDNLQVCDEVMREFYVGDYYNRTKKNTYFFVSIDSNGKDCHYEWSTNENNALRRCKQNTKTNGKCTIYALGDKIVWGNPELYKELTGRNKTKEEEELDAEVADAIAKGKAKVAAAKAKWLAEEAAKAAENKSSPLFDGQYSFDLLRYHDDKDWQELGSGYIEINNGIMTVAKKGRTLDTGSIDLYDSFEGQIDKKGNIMSSLKIPVLFGVDSTPSVDLNGSIDSQLQGEWDNYFDVILKLGKKE